MKVSISPSVLSGIIAAPPSKSMAHRLLICAGLSCGRSTVTGIDFSQDIKATLSCLEALGVRTQRDGDAVTVYGTDISGLRPAVLDCRECGSTLRFLLPLCMMSGSEKTLTGSRVLMSRPLDVYEKICRIQGISFTADGDCVRVSGKLGPGHFDVRGDISSQFVSGLMFALPLLEGDSTVRIIPPFESRPYVYMTQSVMKLHGVRCEWKDDLTLFIPGRQKYAPCDSRVEGDYSNAAFFDAYNCIGGNVSISGLDPDSLQGDKVYGEYFRELMKGCPVLDIKDCPDLGPVLISLAALLNGAVIKGTQRLRIKESDRALAMAQELRHAGADIEVYENEIHIKPAALRRPDVCLDGHNDHRIVMALATVLTVTGGSISGAQAVKKSLPGYFEILKHLGAVLDYDEMDKQ